MDIENNVNQRLCCILVLHPKLIYMKTANNQCILSFNTDAIRDIFSQELKNPISIGDVQEAIRRVLNNRSLKIDLEPKAKPFGGFSAEGYDVSQAFEIRVKHFSSKKITKHTDKICKKTKIYGPRIGPNYL